MTLINTPLFQSNYSLANLNTFGIDVQAARFSVLQNTTQLQKIICQSKQDQIPLFILGGGSNLLLTQDVPYWVLKNDLKGIQIIEETDTHTTVAVGGGENWHEFVLWCVNNDLGGIENLSLIPGTVGAAPIQNIGAYGVELKDVFHKLEAIDLTTGELRQFSHADCQFAYRNSVFKNQLKGKYCLSKVYFKLTKSKHQLHTNYGAIQQTLSKQGITQPTIQAISDAVIAIRTHKLPNPAEIGNSGSFFKNPELKTTQFEALKNRFPNIVSYPMPNKQTKVPAGWLIEQCGWKGKRIGNTGTYKNQALVLVNHGGATGAEIWALAQAIIKSVEEKFGIRLTPEVNVIPLQ